MIMKTTLLASVAAVLLAAGPGAAWVSRPALPGDQFQLAEGSGTRARSADANIIQAVYVTGEDSRIRYVEGNGTQTRVAEGNGTQTRVA